MDSTYPYPHTFANPVTTNSCPHSYLINDDSNINMIIDMINNNKVHMFKDIMGGMDDRDIVIPSVVYRDAQSQIRHLLAQLSEFQETLLGVQNRLENAHIINRDLTRQIAGMEAELTEFRKLKQAWTTDKVNRPLEI